MFGIRGFTLLEIIITVIILGILVSIALPNYLKAKEKALDKEAIANLKLIRSAEITYRMEWGSFYPSAGSESNIANINSNLKLALPSGSNRNWNYTVWNSGCARATRNGADGRSWYLTINDADEEPDPGLGCP
ncbi:MAG: type II secretion system GspH family protein [Candidatus Omnitrophica bacterium]|nr:type II secretion system GspH family protein [Candidatus Omnitrophota bacterium]